MENISILWILGYSLLGFPLIYVALWLGVCIFALIYIALEHTTNGKYPNKPLETVYVEHNGVFLCVLFAVIPVILYSCADNTELLIASLLWFIAVYVFTHGEFIVNLYIRYKLWRMRNILRNKLW